MPTLRQYRIHALFVGVVGVIAVVTVGCSPRSHNPSSTSPSTSLATASTVPASGFSASGSGSGAASTASTTSTSPGATAGSTSVAGGNGCATTQLRLALVDVSGAGGRSYSTYSITNTASRTCVLAPPSISFANSAGVTVKAATTAAPVPTVSLSPAAAVSLVVSDDACAQPAPATQLIVTVVGSPSALALSGQYQVCSPTIASYGTG